MKMTILYKSIHDNMYTVTNLECFTYTVGLCPISTLQQNPEEVYIYSTRNASINCYIMWKP